MTDSSMCMDKCTFANNSATIQGGAVLIMDASLKMNATVVNSNVAPVGAGMIDVSIRYASIELFGAHLMLNGREKHGAQDSGWTISGGGIQQQCRAQGCVLKIASSVIHGNIADNGAGIFQAHPNPNPNSTPNPNPNPNPLTSGQGVK